MIITYWHLRTIPLRHRNGYCIPGAKRVFERYGWDWDDFVASGIDSDALLSVDNNLCTKLVKYAESTPAPIDERNN